MELWKNTNELKAALIGIAEISGGKLSVTKEDSFRKLAENLAYNASTSKDESVRAAARWVIWEGSIALGCPSASIHNLYMARADNAYKDMTVPAINIRALTFYTAKTIFENLKKLNAKTCLFEIARSEITYTFQRPAEYTSQVLAAAIASGYVGPVFLQGDHFQVSVKKWKENPAGEVGAVKELIKEAIEGGFYNIDIDTSTLVDLEKTTVKEQQRNNFEVSEELTKVVRQHEPKGITISVGGEIGEVGKKNSTEEELVAYLEGVNEKLGGETKGPSKISIQTGTSHGGVPLPDGSVAEVSLDFKCLENLGEVARKKFHIGGVVQHGASTLPNEAFHHFPNTQTLEVHLATGFQNILYDSKNFPADLKKSIYAWLSENCAKERKPDWTDEQFYYKTRKKGFGTFKETLWNLPTATKEALMGDLSKTFEFMFQKLNIKDSAKLVEKFVKSNPPHWQTPAGL